MIYLYICLGLGAFSALLILFVHFSNSALCTTEYTAEIGLEKQIKIVHLSDLHGKRFGKDNIKLIKKVKELNPDFIAYTGDIVHLYRPRDEEIALKLVSALCEIAPLYYIAGNHEMRSREYRFLRRQLMEAGATVLDDEVTKFNDLTIVGLNGASLKNDVISRISPAEPKKLLLAHDPKYFEKYAAHGYELVLCGHAHGGQWRIPFTRRGLFAPGQGAFPKYSEGMHVSGNTKMIISRGLGNSEFPLRLFNRPEIVFITVK